MRESAVEKYLRQRVEELGGTCEKFVSPGKRGVPDRIVTMPGGVIEFVETKAPTGRVRAEQSRDHAQRRALGVLVAVVSTKEEVDKYIAELCADLACREPERLH